MTGPRYCYGGKRVARIKEGLRALKRNALAERVAEHGSVARAAEEIGVSVSQGRALWREIVRGLGAQAC